jgi:hypothetical protein
MTEQQRPDEDVEGHMPFKREDAADEVEGHGRALQSDEGLEDDVEGHKRMPAQSEGGDEDDVEGHSPARRPV